MSHTRTPSMATTNAQSADGENPQNMVIASLRNQVGDLVSQVTQLNSKLVQSYDRISDLEDNMHIASSSLRNSTLKISQLELERTQHLSALNTGLLVEKSHVTAELTRLMERATDEAANRGKAESARREIEKDLDDLSAELFDRANTMVAEARLAQAKSERRVQETEGLLKSAEDAVTSMQSQMQVLREEKDRSDRERDKGKWVERPASAATLRLLSTHAPYQEFLLFVAHLRQIRPGAQQPPPMATLLPLPFLVRLVSEDSDPTLRLDAAPALNWLTRRAVSAAIHQSQLTIEPVSASTFLEAHASPAGSAAALAAFSSQSPFSSPAAPAPAAAPAVIPCALCGTPVLGGSAQQQPTPAPSWRPPFFSRTASTSTATPPHTIHSPTPSVATSSSFYPPSASALSPPPTPPPSQAQQMVHVFRAPGSGGSAPPTLYPLCTSGWCLTRLRTTCEVWRFVRHGVVDKVWAEEVPSLSAHVQHHSGGAKPPVPPRRRGMNMGKLIGFALGKGSATGGSGGEGGDEKFSPPPRRVSGERRRSSGLVQPLPPPPPVPRRSEVRARVDEKPARVASPVEDATLFDADAKPDAHAHGPANGDANPEQARTPVDPAHIALPPSPTAETPDDARPQEAAATVDKKADAPSPSTGSPTTAPPSAVSPSADPALSPSGNASSVPAPPAVPRRAARRAAPVPPGTKPKPGAEHEPKPASEDAPKAEDAAKTENADTSKEEKQDTPKTESIPNGEPKDAPKEESADEKENPPKADKVEPDVFTDTKPPAPSAFEPPPLTPPPPRNSSPPPRTRSPLPVEASPRHGVRDPSPSSRRDEHAEAYVGDVTWEERTWKELVRLREDMFYARIGSVR